MNYSDLDVLPRSMDLISLFRVVTRRQYYDSGAGDPVPEASSLWRRENKHYSENVKDGKTINYSKKVANRGSGQTGTLASYTNDSNPE